mgnify:CR=1 FL=1
MKTIIFDGRVGANGTEIKMSKNGKTYARFNVANNTFVNGEEKTEWFDVIVYDPTFIEKRAQYLGKGSYVIITGSIRTEVRPDNTGKLWVNNYVTASNVDTPRLGNKPENKDNVVASTVTTPIPSAPVVSTFTGGTRSDISEMAATPQVTPQVAPQVTPQVTAQPHYATVGASVSASVDDSDLPF